MTTVKLEKIKVACQKLIQDDLLDNEITAHDLTVHISQEFAAQIIKFVCTGNILGETLKEYRKTYYQLPHWIEKLIDRFRPKWKHVYVVNLKAMYPKLKLSLPKEYNSIVMERYDL
jgi:hypothetical protein